jgi:hypothetical protein
MAELTTNAAQTTLNGSITNVAATMVVTSATGFPASGNFRCLISAEGANTDEIVTVTAVSGTTFTISRATEAYAGVQSASAHGNAAMVTHVLTSGGLAGIIDDIRSFIRADATRTFTSNTNAQNIFTNPTNGRITLPTGVYRFHGLLIFTNLSTTNGNVQIDWLGAGTATITHWLWHVWGVDATADVATTVATSRNATNLSAASILNPGTGQGLTLQVDGSFDITGAGTLIPTSKMVTASASVLSIGSFLMYERMGASGVISAGPWD